MLVIALSSFRFRTNPGRYFTFSVFIILFLWVDFNYLHKGADLIFTAYSEKRALQFKRAIDRGIIRANTTKLYIRSNNKEQNFANAIGWDLGEGAFFEFYGQKAKRLVFVDPVHEKSYFPASSTFRSFDKATGQIITADDEIADETDSLLNDTTHRIGVAAGISYNENDLLITNDDFDKFYPYGFYDEDNGIRWTNGNVGFRFKSDYTVKDSLNIVLTTFMAPACKNIRPAISLTDKSGNIYQEMISKSEGGQFIYTFYFAHTTTLQKISILSGRIDAAPDRRVLSFPFISLELKQ
jgi:hypothetical protein